MFDEEPVDWQGVKDQAQSTHADGNTIMYISQDDKVVGHIGVQDQVREATTRALAELDSMSPPIQKVMKTKPKGRKTGIGASGDWFKSRIDPISFKKGATYRVRK